jgi:hypothetical protein
MLFRSAIIGSAALIVLSTAQTQSADGDKEVAAIEDTVNEIQMEATQCWAYFEFVKHCAENDKRTDLVNLADSSIQSAKKIAFLYGTTHRMTPDAMTSRFKMALEEQKELIASSCVNLASLYVRYGKRCKEVIEHPDAVYKNNICAKANESDDCQTLRALDQSSRH